MLLSYVELCSNHVKSLCVKLSHVELPDEEHGLAPAGLLRVPGVTQHQPLDTQLSHGTDHGLGGLSVASEHGKLKFLA